MLKFGSAVKAYWINGYGMVQMKKKDTYTIHYFTVFNFWNISPIDMFLISFSFGDNIRSKVPELRVI